MCGITGIYNMNGDGIIAKEVVQRMADTLVHRGPDDEGFFIEGPIGLGHRRLSIIDIKSGHQPIFNEDRSVAIVFNGEIYNHHELRAELEAQGHLYRTNSDTESIIHAYEQFENGFETHLTGMFAFAIWDARRSRLVLSRDRLGIKPLYYTIHRNRLVFASEIKAILTVEGIDRRVDQEALDAFLTLRYVPGPKTMFKDIFKLQPGHTLTAQDGHVTIRPYWDLTFGEDSRDESRAVEELETLLFEVCQSHLMSEVPYGIFLSGGLDSSSIVAVLNEILKSRVQTFTVGYENGGGINEFSYAGVVAKHAGTEHHELTLSAKNFADWIPKLVWHMDEPVGDAACVPLYFLAQYAKTRATVLHSGEGADEVFGGYSIYKKMRAINNLQIDPLSYVARIISGGLTPLAGSGKLARYLRLLGLPLEERYRGVSGHSMEGIKHKLVRPQFLAELERCSYLPETFAGYYGQVRTAKDLNKMLFIDMKTWLPDDLLIKADKMTMAASVELRVPFLDHRLVEFAARLSVSHKIKNGETKYLLKKMMQRYLPSGVIYRPKKGFPVPVAAWFRGNLYDLACEMLLNTKSGVGLYFEPDAIGRMLAQHKAGHIDLSNELWSVLILEYWFRTFKAT